MDVIIMTKKRSPHLVKFSPDPDDSHFWNVELIRLKSREVVTYHYILAADVPQWRRMYEQDGFRPIDTNNKQDIEAEAQRQSCQAHTGRLRPKRSTSPAVPSSKNVKH